MADRIVRAFEALRRFGVQVQELRPVSGRTPTRSVWLVRSRGGELVLKSHDSCRRAAVATATGRYLYLRGVPVAQPLAARDGRLVVDVGGDCFALFRFMPGTPVHYQQAETALAATALLARFHEGSRGYMRSGGPAVEKRLDWERIYMRRREKLHAVVQRAQSGHDPFSEALRSRIPWLEARVRWAEEALPRTALKALEAAAGRDPLLGHGDFAGNVLQGSDGALFVIDLDSVALHLPVWDLSRLICYVDHDMQGFCEGRFEQMLQAYRSVRPLTMEEAELLRVDQVYPHHLLDLAATHYEGGRTPTALEELERILRTDQTKLSYLGVEGLAQV